MEPKSLGKNAQLAVPIWNVKKAATLVKIVGGANALENNSCKPKKRFL